MFVWVVTCDGSLLGCFANADLVKASVLISYGDRQPPSVSSESESEIRFGEDDGFRFTGVLARRQFVKQSPDHL